MSFVGDTASITLITAPPGSGKTLRAVWYIRQAIAAGELVFVCNINGINVPGVQPFDDPWKWQELPPGSVLVVDEAQKFWRAGVTEVVQDATTGKPSKGVPLCIQAMETLRHQGVRLVLLTQHPVLLHLNIRQLVGLHEHLVRENGRQEATIYRRSSCIDNVRSEKALKAEDNERWAFPKDCYDLYKSAEIHTVKRTISAKYMRTLTTAVIAGVLFVGTIIFLAVKIMGGGDSSAEQPRKSVALGSDIPPPNERKSGQPKWHTQQEYDLAHQPRRGQAPWSAPVFDDRSVTADPQLYCMSSGQGSDNNGDWQDYTCTCLTEQGTAYEMEPAACRTVARRGQDYNPYRQMPSSSAQVDAYAHQEPTRESSAVSVATGRNLSKTFPESPGYTCDTCQ
ncbi:MULTISPECIES: zonular occludens toxin domain-containing protein [unclassified Pseudoxanthomonas]|uniref:zonular occludens toxin domain-containing protein n=1 Tax=unclassified Pseudoxanthomonas TaxID=2645906 RepID=UPI00307DC405